MVVCSKSDISLNVAGPDSVAIKTEVRCAVRFPIALPAVLDVGGRKVAALTRNISASGVLFAADCPFLPGAEIRYSIRMPGQELGAPGDILVHCTGRLVRCTMSGSQFFSAFTIDEYRFAHQETARLASQ
jgi:hypothetical protein